MKHSASMQHIGILLMGYGSPAKAEDLPGYLTDVLGGRRPPPELVEEYRRRYELIGWSPQLRILTSLRAKLKESLARDGTDLPVFLGTKHWTPHISEVIPEAAATGVTYLVAVPLSPYASPWIVDPYRRAIENGIAHAASGIQVDLRTGWHLNPHWRGYWADCLRQSLQSLPSGTVPLMSAHSLPERHRRTGDPYPAILAETVRAIVGDAGLTRWDFSYQSAGNTTEPWLGPDITEKMVEWSSKGHSEQLVAPVGFLFEHLEVLYDLDVVVKEFASQRGIGYHRCPMPNDHPRVVEALRSVALAGLPAR